MKFEFTNNRYCTYCGHVRMQHYSVFKQKVSTPIIRYGYKGAGREALSLLKEEVRGDRSKRAYHSKRVPERSERFF